MLEDWLFRPFLTGILKLLFRVEVRGVEHYYAAGDKVIIVSNHQSFIDPLLLAVLVPEKPAFAMNVYQSQKWYFRWVNKVVSLYKLDPAQPMSMKRLIRDLREGTKVVIFPEGRITTTGGIMKIYDGTGLIIEKTGAMLLPVRIDGAEYTKFSRMGGKLRQRWFPKIRLTFLPPVQFNQGQEVGARVIYDIMTEAAFIASDYKKPMLAAALDAFALHGGSHAVVTDMTRVTLNYRQLFTRAFVLSGKVAALTGDEKNVGVLLPTAPGALVTFIALHMLGKVPAMLNFSAGEGNVAHACRIACVKTVLTSRAFIEKGKFEKLAAALEKECRVIYLEDIRPSITLVDKLSGLYKSFCPMSSLAPVVARTKASDPAVILYTSGSEGTPKGVVLSHTNVVGNIAQACARLDLNTSDILFNALPVFHSFGLTIGTLMPLLRGIKVFMYPSPVHYRVIPELIYDSDATIMLGTDTFFRGYARYANAYDFQRIRLAVAGAEKLKESTRAMYADKFHLLIMEGYGVTETSPAVAFNTLIENKIGTIGRVFPGMQTRIEPVEGLERGGRLLIKGDNVMLGYLKADQPGVIQPHGEWYDTGDIVEIDEDGFVTISGRAKRFAKIAGEMVSLSSVEDLASSLYPDAGHAAVAVADERKGEQVILFTEAAELTKEALTAQARSKGIGEIYLPRQVQIIEAIPRLGNGKIDYVAINKLIAAS